MAQAVPERPYLLPRLFWHKGGSKIAKLGGRFADPFQAALYGIAALAIFFEGG